MSDHHQPNPLDENLRRMLESAVERPSPGFEARLSQHVLTEVARWEGRSSAPGRRRLWLFAAAALIAIGAFAWIRRPAAALTPTVGRLDPVYGMVAVLWEGRCRPVTGAVDLRSGERIEASGGTKARILLADQSRLTPDPRSRLQIVQTATGPNIVLEQGAIRLEAAKQPAGKQISIATEDSHIKVLGTDLEVRLARKPDGTRQTRVHVRSGRVEMESGGHKILILPGTEGIAEEGGTPVRSSVFFEVNELIRLHEKTLAMARETGDRPGLPEIIDAGAATLWSLVPFDRLARQGDGRCSLSLRYPAFQVQVFTLEGEAIPSQGQGRVLTLNLGDIQGGQPPQYLAIRVPHVSGLFTTARQGIFELGLPSADPHVTSLVQVHLPPGAHLEEVSPDALEMASMLGRQIITIVGHCELPAVAD
jgi:hypothetical protein